MSVSPGVVETVGGAARHQGVAVSFLVAASRPALLVPPGSCGCTRQGSEPILGQCRYSLTMVSTI